MELLYRDICSSLATRGLDPTTILLSLALALYRRDIAYTETIVYQNTAPGFDLILVKDVCNAAPYTYRTYIKSQNHVGSAYLMTRC